MHIFIYCYYGDFFILILAGLVLHILLLLSLYVKFRSCFHVQYVTWDTGVNTHCDVITSSVVTTFSHLFSEVGEEGTMTVSDYINEAKRGETAPSACQHLNCTLYLNLRKYLNAVTFTEVKVPVLQCRSTPVKE